MLKRTWQTVIACVLAFALVLSVTACGTAATVEINQTSATIGVGDTLRLTATASDNSAIEWSTSNEQIATVATNGTVRGVAEGKATITAKTESGASATCEVTVEEITVTLNKTTLTLERFATEKLTATDSKGGTSFVWSTSDEAIATVSDDGTVTALKEGTATITARRDGGTSRATCEVTVVWSDKPAGYYEIGHYEQNKVPANTWGRWANQNWEGGGVININSAEYEDQQGSEAGKIVVDFEVEAHGTLAGADLQVVYRSAGEDGHLKTGAYYAVTLDITSTVAGNITLNGVDFTLEANKKATISADFLHADDGAICAEGDYDNIYYTAIFLLLGNLDSGKVTVENIKWEEFTPTVLEAPSFAISEKNITVTDTNTDGVGGYTVGFFAREESTTPKYSVTFEGKTATIDDSLWINGVYYAKIKANGTSVRYAESAWSDAHEYSVSHESVEYDLKNSTEADLENDVWGFWSEQDGWVTGTYKDDVITITIDDAAKGRLWHAIQLFHKNTALASGKTYTVYFKLNSTVAGVVRFGNENHDIVVGDNELSYTVTGGGTTFSFAFAEPDTSNWNDALSTLEGTFIFSNFDWEEVGGSDTPTPPPASEDPADYELGEEILPSANFEKNAEGDATDDTFAYWYAEDASWGCGDPVTMTENKLENGVITLSYTGGSVDFSVQLFYKNTNLKAGAKYFIFATIEVSGDLQVKLNGKVMQLTAGSHDVYALFNSGSALTMQCYGVGTGNMTVKVSNVKWKEVLGGGAEVPPVDDDPVGTQYRPNYDKVVNGDETGAKADEWTYWNDQNWVGSEVTVTKSEAKDGALNFEFSGNTETAAWFGFQIFYKNSEMSVGSKYTLSFKITVSKACSITINGQVKELQQGENTVTVDFTYGGDLSAFDLQFGVNGGQNIGGFVGDLVVTISDVVWTKAE